MTLRLALLVALTAMLASAACAAARAEESAEPTPVPPLGEILPRYGHFRHTAKYPPLALAWKADARLDGVTGAFPHPVLSGRVAVATSTGVVLSEDAGATWTPLPALAADRLGHVVGVDYAPDAPDTWLLATEARGVWRTDDAGRTVTQVGSKAAGMADDRTVAAAFYPGDLRVRTLLAIHGEAAPGVSVSRDAGRTWTVTGADSLCHRMVLGRAGDSDVLLVASRADAPAVRSIYYAATVGDYWVEIVRDVVATGAGLGVLYKGENWAADLFRGAHVYLSTADDGLQRVSKGGAQRIGPKAIPAFADVGVTWGPNADTEVVFAYEPGRFGLLTSTDAMATLSRAGAGLPTGPYIKEGASVRASANGAAFFAVINQALYVARRARGPVAVTGARAEPALVTFQGEKHADAMKAFHEEFRRFPKAARAADEARRCLKLLADAEAFLSARRVTVTATARAVGGAALEVTADLTRLGGEPMTPMRDDGSSGDGAAGDGVYGVHVRLDPRRLRDDTRDWRGRIPGTVGLTVTARGADGALDGEVALVQVFARRESFYASHGAKPVTVAAGEPWSLTVGDVYRPQDIAGYYAIGFWIRTDVPDAGEITLALVDQPEYDLPVSTDAVAVKDSLVGGGKVDGQWRLAVVPLAPLMKAKPEFRASRAGQIIFAGRAPAAGTVEVRDVQYLVGPDDAEALKGVSPK